MLRLRCLGRALLAAAASAASAAAAARLRMRKCECLMKSLVEGSGFIDGLVTPATHEHDEPDEGCVLASSHMWCKHCGGTSHTCPIPRPIGPIPDSTFKFIGVRPLGVHSTIVGGPNSATEQSQQTESNPVLKQISFPPRPLEHSF